MQMIFAIIPFLFCFNPRNFFCC